MFKIKQAFMSPLHNSMGDKDKNNMSIDKTEISEYMSDLLKRLDGAQDHSEALHLLYDGVKSGDLTQKNGVLFKNGEYTIQNIFKTFGFSYEQNLKKISKLGLSITPQYVKTIVKDNDMFLVTRIKGTKTGELLPYREAGNLVSKEDKLAAYKDLQTLTKAGIVDDQILRGMDMWFVTPDDHKIILPSFERLRPLRTGENQQIMETYHNILFGQN